MSNVAQELSRLIANLQVDRQKHVDAIAEIDAVFGNLGISAAAPKRRGRKPGATAKAAVKAAPAAGKKGGKKRRRKSKSGDGLTGEQFLYKVLADGALLTAEINDKWKASGRNGRADILLGQLVASGKLNRKKTEGERGSRYSVA